MRTLATLPPVMNGTAAAFIAVAEAKHEQYPQYKNFWRGPEWRLVRITRLCRGKLGISFVKGDATIARREPADPRYGLPEREVAYSVRTGCNTMLKLTDVQVV